jgi:signal transduction histidine kinase
MLQAKRDAHLSLNYRATELFKEHQLSIFKRTDFLFAVLMVLQWFLGIFIAIWISPRVWEGEVSSIHIHVWAAIILGGIITSFPVLLALSRPGWNLTRHSIAVGQMLTSTLLIHLTGGRIETHFHVFGSLAILAFYRDWRVLITGSTIVYLDHLIRGIYWPRSVYGVLSATPWRALEHGVWVLFEVTFLIIAIRQSLKEMEDMAMRQATLETTNRLIENKVADRTRELAATNQTLTDFAYVVSHDLKAPLRGISSLASWIQTDYEDKLDHEGKELTRLLIGRVQRMHNLIEGILHYSRIGRLEREKFRIHLDELVQQVTENLLPPSHIKISVVNQLPTLLADKTQIEQVFQNLLSNAIKFMDKPNGEIKVGAEKNSHHWKFYVSDNGPGIEEKYFEKIFQLFQTLKPRDEFESSGIGLAVVKKIVENHRGKVWVESAVGKGSTFFFTLPTEECAIQVQANGS